MSNKFQKSGKVCPVNCSKTLFGTYALYAILPLVNKQWNYETVKELNITDYFIIIKVNKVSVLFTLRTKCLRKYEQLLNNRLNALLVVNN